MSNFTLRDRRVNARSASCLNSVLNVKAVVAAFNQEKAIVGAFSVIVQPIAEPMEHYTALVSSHRNSSNKRLDISSL